MPVSPPAAGPRQPGDARTAQATLRRGRDVEVRPRSQVARTRNRRRFLAASSAVLASVAGTGAVTLEPGARAYQNTKAQRDALTPDEIIAGMLAGNERFMNGKQRPRDFLVEQRATVAGQYPAAVALSCV